MAVRVYNSVNQFDSIKAHDILINYTVGNSLDMYTNS